VGWSQSISCNWHEFLNEPAIVGSGHHRHLKVNVRERGRRAQPPDRDCIGDSSGDRHACRRIGLWEYYHKFSQTVPKEYVSSPKYLLRFMGEPLD
jgi:hypothetical protein